MRSVRASGWGSWFWTTLTWLLTAVFLLPIFWMVITSFKPEAAAFTKPPVLIFEPTLAEYREVLGRNFAPYFINSAMASVGSTLLVLVLALPAAYALSIRSVGKWRDVLFFFISTRMLPFVGVIVPIYVVAKNIGLLDNILLLILIYTGMNIPIAVWLLRSFLLEIPREVMEAARLDGAHLHQEITRVIVPIISPGIAATAVICTVFAWNEFFFAVSLTTTQAATVPMFLVSFITSRGLFWAKLSAATTMGVLPILVMGWLAQKQIIRGLSMGSTH